MDETILVERDGPIATVVLNRADKLNALTRAMWSALGDAVERLGADGDVRCIVIRGAGERAFSPGNDISEFETQRSNKAQAIEYGKAMHRTADQIVNCPAPIVAQIHGICVGGGLEIAALGMRFEQQLALKHLRSLGLPQAGPRDGLVDRVGEAPLGVVLGEVGIVLAVVAVRDDQKHVIDTGERLALQLSAGVRER